MPKITQKFVVFPASKGLNANRNVALLKPDELVTAKNIVFDTATTARKKRPGLALFANSSRFTTSNNVRGLYNYYRTVTGTQSGRMMAFIDGRMYSGDVNGVFTDITGTATLIATDRVSFETFDGLLIMSFQSTTPKRWTQSGNISDLITGNMADGDAAGYLSLYRTHNGYGWASGDPTKPHRLFKSDVGDPTTWTGGSAEYFDIDVGDQDPVGITAIFPSLFGDLYVAKRKSLHKVYVADATTSPILFGVEPVVQGIGCISPNTVVPIQNDIIFVSERGVHSLSSTDKYGEVEAGFLSSKIHKTFIDELDFNKLNDMWAVYSPDLNSYLLSFPRKGATYVDDLLGYNLINAEWYRWEQYNVAAMTQYIDGQNRTRIAVANNVGKIGLIDSETVTDFGESVTTLCKTGIIYPFGSPTEAAGFKNLSVFYVPKGNYNFTVSYKIDGLDSGTLTFSQAGLGGTALGEFTLGVDQLGFTGKVKSMTQPLNGYGTGIELIFTQTPSVLSNNEEDVEILGFTIEVEGAEDTAETITQG